VTVTALHHYNLRAPRAVLEELRAFYCEVIGLAVGPRPPFSSFGYWLYAGTHAVLHLSDSGAASTPALEVRSTFDHAAFSCTQPEAFEARLGSLGVPYRRAYVPQTRQLQLFLTDPAGNGVELNFGELRGD
jgi:catechol-2,3-dioxygenase